MKKRNMLYGLLAISAVLGLAACKNEKKPPVDPVEEVIEYTIKFDSKQGSAVEDKKAKKDEKISAPTAPTRQGHVFDGWFKDEAYTKPWNFSTDVVTGSITLYAKWSQVFSVTYVINGHGTQPENLADQTKLPAELPTLTEAGWRFDGWYIDESFQTAAETGATLSANATLYAKWTQVFSVTYVINGHGTQPENLVDQTKLPDELPQLTEAGWRFDGWYTDESFQTAAEAGATLSANTTLYAKWTQVFSVTYVINGHGTQPENLADQTKLPDTLPILTQTGWTFDGWYIDSDFKTLATAEITLTEDITLYAKWGVEAGKIFMNGKEYSTILAAFADIPATSTETYVISLGKGTYNENGLMYKGSATIRIIGYTTAKYGSDVVIKGHGRNMSGVGADSKTRCLISIQGTGNIYLENISLESDWSRADHSGDVQAEVLGTDSTGFTAAYNCGFKSHQDTLRTAGKAWFYGCYIEGDVDFMWMESSGKVALYENCEIVSLWDANASTHRTYLAAPRMTEAVKVGKGLVVYNSTIKETEAAKANGQETYLARTPWSSGFYNQVAYINTKCDGVEVNPWYGSQIATPFAPTQVGWKMDKATADSIGITGDKNYILDADTISKEYNGRNAILNRMFDTGKLRYVTDSSSNWDINAFINVMGWDVVKDNSSDRLEGDTMGEPTVYDFNTADVPTGAICNGFALESGKTHYRGQSGSTITIPVNGKCYIEVYGYYSGTVEATADTQEGKIIKFFNNGSTSKVIENDFTVYDENAKSFVITAKSTTYITKIIVIPDASIQDKKAETITIKGADKKQTVGVPLELEAEVGPNGVINTSVLWSSSDESIAKVDSYSGKVTFITAGTVTITATACDGSGVTASVTCNPVAANWTAIEWYTIDNDLATNDGNASGYDVFDCNSSAYKKFSKAYTFENLEGKKISTQNGLKLNSTGKLSFATTFAVDVCIIIAPEKNASAVNPPVITNETGAKVTNITQNIDPETGLQTFTYTLTAGVWDIQRSDTNGENNPILYVQVVKK